MKNFSRIKRFGIILLGISAFFLSSCSKSPQNLKTIPKETKLVSVIDIYSIAQKGKLSEISDLKIIKTIKKEIKQENRKVSKIFDNLIEDPTISGIDFKTEIYAYYINEAKDEKFFCVSAALKSENKFSDFIEDLLDKAEIKFDIENENDYNYTIIGNELAIAWDADNLIFITPENYKSRENLELEIDILFDLKENNQIMANEHFTQFYKNRKDVSLWLSTGLFEDSYDFKKLEKEIDVDISDNYLSAYLNFEEGQVTLLAQITPNKEVQKILEENNIWSNDFNSELLDVFPKQNYAAMSIAIDPMSYYQILDQEKSFGKFKDLYQKETGYDLEDLFTDIQGSAVFSLFGIENIEYSYTGWGYGFNEENAELLDKRYEISETGYLSEEDKRLLNSGKTIQSKKYSDNCINILNILEDGGTVESAIRNNDKINWYTGGWEYGKYVEKTKEELLPIMGLTFDIGSSKQIEQLIKLFPEDELIKHNNYYEFKVDGRYPAYLAFNENICLITNGINCVEVFNDGGYNNDALSESTMKNDMAKNHLFAYINLNYDDYPKDFKKELKKNLNDQEYEALKTWNDFAKSIELKQMDNNSMVLIFKTKSHDDNSLQTVMQTIEENYKDFLSL